jgi:hypothetical protein
LPIPAVNVGSFNIDDGIPQATVASVKRAFNSLKYTPNDILLFNRFEEYDDKVQITEELWPDLLPSLTLVQVALDPPSRQQGQVSGSMESKFSCWDLRIVDNIWVHSFCDDNDRWNDTTQSQIFHHNQ